MRRNLQAEAIDETLEDIAELEEELERLYATVLEHRSELSEDQIDTLEAKRGALADQRAASRHNTVWL